MLDHTFAGPSAPDTATSSSAPPQLPRRSRKGTPHRSPSADPVVLAPTIISAPASVAATSPSPPAAVTAAFAIAQLAPLQLLPSPPPTPAFSGLLLVSLGSSSTWLLDHRRPPHLPPSPPPSTPSPTPCRRATASMDGPPSPHRRPRHIAAYPSAAGAPPLPPPATSAAVLRRRRQSLLRGKTGRPPILAAAPTPKRALPAPLAARAAWTAVTFRASPLRQSFTVSWG
ncbi:hypothetical protein HK405_001251 [Cladochytrium tenue]|nr:hypothetical protein HK405_001251 [Cladochytrium tenue]